ncbi:cupin domain-containing protein [Psychroserpens sp.]
MKVTKTNSKEYSWGQKCKGWHLLNTNELSIIQEIMPIETQEVKHKHSKSQQFFYILQGQATFIIGDKKYKVDKNQGMHINPNIIHQIKNQTNENLEFLVISQPHSHGDKIIENE